MRSHGRREVKGGLPVVGKTLFGDGPRKTQQNVFFVAGSAHRAFMGIAVGGYRNLLATRRNPALFRDDTISPLNKRDKDGRVAELRAPIGKVIFRNPTGSGAGSSRKHRNVSGDDFLSQFTEWRPTNGNDGIRRSLAHQIGGISGQKDLNFVTCV